MIMVKTIFLNIYKIVFIDIIKTYLNNNKTTKNRETRYYRYSKDFRNDLFE